jgi:hypothetical protein
MSDCLKDNIEPRESQIKRKFPPPPSTPVTPPWRLIHDRLPRFSDFRHEFEIIYSPGAEVKKLE